MPLELDAFFAQQAPHGIIGNAEHFRQRPATPRRLSGWRRLLNLLKESITQLGRWVPRGLARPLTITQPDVYFHFTPTSASWLNQVEIWFGIMTRKTLRGASFNSTDQLTQAINDFIAAYNDKARPFVWRKREVRGSQLRNTIVNLRN